MPARDHNAISNLRELQDPVAVLAFSGWNDAGSAATDAVLHLIEVSDADLLFSLDGEDHYDFQVNRPMVSRGEDGDRISWPRTDVWIGRIGERDLVLITGPEPNMRWRSYAAQIVSALRSAHPSLVVVLGSLLADNAHTRPVPVSRSSADPRVRERLGLSRSTYEGPTGITGVLSAACTDAGMDVASLWAAVPHYVAQPPNPKATLALLHRLEDLAEVTIDPGELPELGRAWERGVAELIDDDAELSSYVASLEADQDETELPEASGDAIAAEFERYLRRRNDP
ncbi:PAC2 family protein [Enemella evansiae]|uniref:Carboxylate--amine ligase n=1 Tax=Enemella evansiae TaxID=2016499 RepID=A0A255G4C0_9ACTN|nr:PAC2 family protein [Enemella evansiae]PFG67271.1 PAC2 family protein [Propionibacteriaceae bacterium ES.041]OYN98457.1 carboxylate--amine ligase [Enemella evansiae]OYN99431.1 carboxylate--amine ligase [Enemella evansiae]OYO06538.1 carboxylate--amine ligase [Enemella evansiae]OYO10778.1 carboxylate--amine ligase [Enemella evansiae]